ncbi:MAG: hypothetical protein ACFB0G_02665 [Leptolyngbyaceae cyanobacterium]
MNSRQIESWALRIIDCVENGQPNEDFLVELKRDWIDPYKAARRIAGHANAARGENIPWLIGVDEIEGVKGVKTVELADWHSKLEASFDELAPEMTALNIPVNGEAVVALLFQTERAPYVVKNPNFGQEIGAIELEVPWRVNTRVRAARRSDLIRLLSPLELLPEIEVLGQKLEVTIAGCDSVGNYQPDELRFIADLYIVPKNNSPIVIPFHRCRVSFSIEGFSAFEASRVRLKSTNRKSIPEASRMSTPGSLTIESTTHEMIVHGPGKFSLFAFASRPTLTEAQKKQAVAVTAYLLPASADRSVVVSSKLTYPEEKYPS